MAHSTDQDICRIPEDLTHFVGIVAQTPLNLISSQITSHWYNGIPTVYWNTCSIRQKISTKKSTSNQQGYFLS